MRTERERVGPFPFFLIGREAVELNLHYSTGSQRTSRSLVARRLQLPGNDSERLGSAEPAGTVFDARVMVMSTEEGAVVDRAEFLGVGRFDFTG
jgi:hypothetical protein